MFEKIPSHKTNRQVVPTGVLKGHAGTIANLAVMAYEDCKNHCTSARWYSEFAFRFQQGRLMGSAFRLSSDVLSALTFRETGIPVVVITCCSKRAYFGLPFTMLVKAGSAFVSLLLTYRSKRLHITTRGFAMAVDFDCRFCPPRTNVNKNYKISLKAIWFSGLMPCCKRLF